MTGIDVLALSGMEPRQVTIDPRYKGPPGSGNGGYSCGLAATAFTDDPAEVTLRLPPPLDTPMDVVPVEGGAELRHGDQVVASICRSDVELEIPPPPDAGAVREAAAAFDVGSYGERHPFAGCFTCGPGREAGDGLRLFPGNPGSWSGVAWPWTPDESLDAGNGGVRPEVMWAALDCPGAHSWLTEQATGGLPVVLGRLAAKIERRARVGEDYTVAGWQLGREGRRLGSGTAVWSADGELYAAARATWVVLDPDQAAAFTAGT